MKYNLLIYYYTMKEVYFIISFINSIRLGKNLPIPYNNKKYKEF